MDVVDVKDLGEYEGWTIDGEFTSIASTVTPNPTGIPLLKGEEKGVSSQSH
jgi:hypothetical protein